MSFYFANPIKKRRLHYTLLICSTFGFVSLQAQVLSEHIERILPSIVKIKVQRAEPLNDENELISIDSGGSGFVLDNEHHIVTNAHVIGDAKKIVIIDLSNIEYPAILIGKDDKSDIAVLEVKSFDAAVLKDNNNSEAVTGESVFAIGAPYSLGHSASYGIISAVKRFLPNYPYVRFLQTDAAINPGNSGGPLFNEKGELIGMNSTYFSKQGYYTNIGFAIEINDVNRIASQLIRDKKITRGYLGAELLINERYVRKQGYQNGVIVTRIQPDSSASIGGLLPGDIIIKIAGNELKDGGELHRFLEQSKPNDILLLTVSRNKEIRQINIKLAIPVTEKKETCNIGSGDAAEKLGLILEEKADGLEVLTTYNIAKIVGIDAKDRVMQINGTNVKTIEEVKTQLSKLKELDMALVTLKRNGIVFSLPLGSKNALKAYSSKN